MRLKRDSWDPIKIDIPDETEQLPLKVKRLELPEAIELRAKWKEAENAPEEKKAEHWGRLFYDSFQRFAKLDCGELIIERDGVEVSIDSPEKLIPFYGGEVRMMNEIFFSILKQGSLDGQKKRTSPPATDSPPSSEERERALPGRSPEPTATSAEGGTSADNGDAPAPQEPSLSGSTEGEKTDPPSSSTSVQFSY